ncbi:c-type cytochrome [Comamonas kerstersii]|jgi:cytochrome c553|uniref:Cytochrome C n=1 Tax=Comamonas kerstersii TaxID=225992 RepID=A0A0W7Z4X1_9BURK|nr:c-type cytochrome [Comamonas kerstersii]EBN0460686.1 cytochrome c4 [Salmonella enterica subsp. enterica serovar Dublin]MDO4968556.1 c-type cytochrome [Comamonadaceae bacterium]AQZ97498.1 cytochrome c4 [Comamonas kerstersii]KAB0586345.1 cytochrome c4 [Comamonas kerstersii]KUF42270.1 cytochrome C [Comamonas kerstersii]
MKLLASLMTAAALAAPVFPAIAAGETPAKADLVQGQASYEAVCAACHGVDGNSQIVINPKLAQQHPEYLIKQLHDFKDDKRADPVMKGFAMMLSDEEMNNISAWLAQQKAQPGYATDKELVQLGERIYRGGIADRNIAACASCHSPNGAGIPSQYPRLAGQHADYTIKQLNTFRDGSRNNSVQMRDVAAKMTDREIKAVADYIAGLR